MPFMVVAKVYTRRSVCPAVCPARVTETPGIAAVMTPAFPAKLIERKSACPEWCTLPLPLPDTGEYWHRTVRFDSISEAALSE